MAFTQLTDWCQFRSVDKTRFDFEAEKWNKRKMGRFEKREKGVACFVYTAKFGIETAEIVSTRVRSNTLGK